MLRLIKRHTDACNTAYRKANAGAISANKKPKNKPEGDYKCKHPCSFVVIGPNPNYDPTSSDPGRINSRIKITLDCDNLPTATQKMRDIEHDLILNPDKPREVTLADALRSYRKEKGTTSRERRGKHERVVFRRQVLFLGVRYGLIDEAKKIELDVKVSKEDEPERERKIYEIAEQIPILKPTNLEIDDYLKTFDGKISSRKDNRANVMSFWRWVWVKKMRPDNIAASAARIVSAREENQEKGKRRPTFTAEERNAYMRLCLDPKACADILKRENEQDPDASEKTRCLAWMQVESAMAMVDCVTFAGDEIGEELPEDPDALPVIHRRCKTGQIARPVLPKVLVEQIRNTFKWDSDRYPFWSGDGDPENRGKTYRDRLKKLFVAAGIRVYERMKKRKSGGVTKDEPENVFDSHGDPHFWRHTWVRDAYLEGTPIEEIAEYLGDEVGAVKEYYSCFDDLRHANLVKNARLVRQRRATSYASQA